MYTVVWSKRGRVASMVAVCGMLFSTSPLAADQVGGTDSFAPQKTGALRAITEPECPGCKNPNTGRVSFNLGMDFATQYLFRGIVQENAGFIGQPYAEINVDVYRGDGAVSNVTLTGGVWNSFHSRETGKIGSDTGPDSWYEADLYAGVSTNVLDALELSTTYTAYTSPNDAFDTIQEVAFGVTIDDSDLLGPFAVSPSALFAIEIENSAFGPDKGTYLELSWGPEFSPAGRCPATVSLPMRLGLSLEDYYATTETAPGFGFFDIGLEGALPLDFIPGEFGGWEATAGVHFASLGRTLRAANSGDDTEVYGLFGIAMTY